MNHPALLCFALASVAGIATARADQCAWNDKAVAERAAALVKPGATVLDFCEPCGDVLQHKKPFVVKSVSIDPAHNSLVVNHAEEDLAYLFVQTAPGMFKNVGIAAQCGASDVSATIENGKPSGRTKPTHAVRPPLPAPPPRPSSIDELAGEWTVRIHTRFSTCPGVKVGSTTATWTVHVHNGAVDVRTDDGLELTGVQDPSNNKIIKTMLVLTKQRSSLGVELTLMWKERFFGQIVRGERQRSSGDPVCVVHQQVSGTRKP